MDAGNFPAMDFKLFMYPLRDRIAPVEMDLLVLVALRIRDEPEPRSG